MRALSLSRTKDEAKRRFNLDGFKIGTLEIGILVARIVKANCELSGNLIRPSETRLNIGTKHACKSRCRHDFWSYSVQLFVREHSK